MNSPRTRLKVVTENLDNYEDDGSDLAVHTPHSPVRSVVSEIGENYQTMIDVHNSTMPPTSTSSLPMSPLTRNATRDHRNVSIVPSNPLSKRLIRAPMDYGKVEKLREAFHKYDVNDDGQIDIMELGVMLQDLGVAGDSSEEVELIKQLDRDGDGGIGFDEFVKFYQNIERSMQTSSDAGYLAAKLNLSERNSEGVIVQPTAQSSQVTGGNETTPVKMKGLLDIVRQSQKDEEKEEYITDKKKLARLRIHGLMYDMPCFAPDYYLRRWWDVLMLVIILYHQTVAPCQAIFDQSPSLLTQLVEWFLTVVLLADVLMCLNTAVQEEDRAFHLVTNRREIFKIYFKSGHFVVDVLSGLPLDLLAYHISGTGAWRICRVLRVLKIFKWRSLFKLSDRGNMDPSVVQFYFWVAPILKKVAVLFLYFNWMVIGRMSIATFELKIVEGCAIKDDRYEFGLDRCHDNLIYRYLYSAWWCWALLTTQGLANVESSLVYAYASLVMLSSLLLQGHVVANMSALLIKADIAEQNRDSMRETLAIMRQYCIPASLQQEVLSFQYHSLQQNAASGFAHILERLPTPMQKEVGLYVRVDLIAKVPMFESLSVDCKLDLASCLEQTYCEPDCFIIEFGEKGNEMYFMMHGFADVIVPSVNTSGRPDPTMSYGTVVTTVKRGDFFGEMALLNPELTRTASIQALSYCDMFQLHTYDFRKLMKDYEELRERVEAEADKRGINRAGITKTRPSFLEGSDLANVLRPPISRGGSERLPMHPTTTEESPRELRRQSDGSGVAVKVQSFEATQSFRRMRDAAHAKRTSLQNDIGIGPHEPRSSVTALARSPGPGHESPQGSNLLFESGNILETSVFSYADKLPDHQRCSGASLRTENAPSITSTDELHDPDRDTGTAKGCRFGTTEYIHPDIEQLQGVHGSRPTSRRAGHHVEETSHENRLSAMEKRIDQMATEVHKVLSVVTLFESNLNAILHEHKPQKRGLETKQPSSQSVFQQPQARGWFSK